MRRLDGGGERDRGLVHQVAERLAQLTLDVAARGVLPGLAQHEASQAEVRVVGVPDLVDDPAEVHQAEDGVHGLERLPDVMPDLLFTDINMPRMDGFGLIEAVRAQTQFDDMPILVLSTESSPEKKERAFDAGASGWIVKPFDPDRLGAAIRRVCP